MNSWKVGMRTIVNLYIMFSTFINDVRNDQMKTIADFLKISDGNSTKF